MTRRKKIRLGVWLLILALLLVAGAAAAIEGSTQPPPARTEGSDSLYPYERGIDIGDKPSGGISNASVSGHNYDTTLYTDVYNANYPFSVHIHNLDAVGNPEVVIAGVLTDYSWIATPNPRCSWCNEWRLNAYTWDGANLTSVLAGTLDSGYDTSVRSSIGTMRGATKVVGVGNLYPCGSGEPHAGMAVFDASLQAEHHDWGDRRSDPCHHDFSTFASVDTADVDGDGTQEIVAGGSGDSTGGTSTYREWLLAIRTSDGAAFYEELYTHFDHGAGNERLTDLAVADVDGDSTQEIVATGYSQSTGVTRTVLRIWRWDGTTLTAELDAHRFNVGSDDYLQRVAVANVDGVAGNEIVVAGWAKTDTTRDWHVRVVRWDGASLEEVSDNTWAFGHDAYIQAVTLSDVDQDGQAEILLAGNVKQETVPGATGGYGYVHYYADWYLKVYSLSGTSWTEGMAQHWQSSRDYDTNKNGQPDSGDQGALGRLYDLDAGDLDGDGQVEVALVGEWVWVGWHVKILPVPSPCASPPGEFHVELNDPPVPSGFSGERSICYSDVREVNPRRTDPKYSREYDRVRYGYILNPSTSGFSRKFEIYYKSTTLAGSGKDYSDLSAKVARLLGHYWWYGKEYMGRAPGFVVKVWLDEGTSGTALAEQWNENLYVYDVDNAVDNWGPTDWIRNLAHEYSHFNIVLWTGPYTVDDPEVWANGYWGERLLPKWMTWNVERYNSDIEDDEWDSQTEVWDANTAYWDTFATTNSGMWLDDQRDVDLMRYFLEQGPTSALISNTRGDGVRYFIGFMYYVDSSHGPLFTKRTQNERGGASPSDMMDSYEGVIESVNKFTIQAGDYISTALSDVSYADPYGSPDHRQEIRLDNNARACYWVYIPEGDWSAMIRAKRQGGAATQLRWEDTLHQEEFALTATEYANYLIRIGHFDTTQWYTATVSNPSNGQAWLDYFVLLRQATATIDPAAGGTIALPNGSITLTVPAHAVASTTTVTYTTLYIPTQETGVMRFADTVFTLEATDASGNPVTEFSQACTLTLTYRDDDWRRAGISDEADLNLHMWNGTEWVALLPCAGCSLNTTDNRLVVVLDHLSEFLLGTEQYRFIYLPFVMKNYP